MLDRLKEIPMVKNIIKKQKEDEKDKQTKAFIMDFLEIKNRLFSVRSKFNITNDDDLTESLIYEEKALVSRYQYMIKLAKLRGVKSGLVLNSEAIKS